MYKDDIAFIKKLYPNKESISLHEPVFTGNERKYVMDTLDSTFVSSVGSYVTDLEKKFAEYTGAAYAVATGNGTLALHTAMRLLDVNENDEVLTQALTFVATANVIRHCGAHPVFIDSDPGNLGMSVAALENWLATHTKVYESHCVNIHSGRTIKACVPMHVFGHPVEIDRIVAICARYSIPVLEDAAESVGSFYKGKHTGLYGRIGIFSFNGNKIMTSGGGGMLVTNDAGFAKRAKHLTTTAKVPHKWNFVHDEVGYNYRMPNLNAALGLAQLEQINNFVKNKRETSKLYADFYAQKGIRFLQQPPGAESNFWLNAIFLENREQRDLFLEQTNAAGIHTRPAWDLMTTLAMYKGCEKTDIPNAEKIYDCLVNLPSSVRGL